MKIEAPAKNRIKIELSAEDLSTLNITYEDMDYSNIETRRVVWTLLDKAGHVLGRDIDPSGRMIIEAVPSKNGGCVLNFTLCPKEDIQKKSSRSSVIHKRCENVCTYEFLNIDDVMDAAAACPAGLCDVKSSLYKLGSKYRLLLRSADDEPKLAMIMGEFATEPDGGSLLAATTCEHWRCVIESEALTKLARN